MRTDLPLRPWHDNNDWAIAVAKLCYERWQAKLPKEKRIRFEDELTDFLCNGFVVSRPDLFWMMKIINVAEKDEPGPVYAWFCRVAVGNMGEIMNSIPVQLPYVAFCRHGDPKLRKYPMAHFTDLAVRLGGTTVEKAMARLVRGEIRCIKNNAD